MRLMAEKGEEIPQDRFSRIKDNGLWVFEREMLDAGLEGWQREAMHRHCDEYYGCVPLQEQMMEILMDSNVAGFTLAQANDARKIVAKKQMSRIPELKELMYNQMSDRNYADYVWRIAIHPSLGYAFSLNHSLPYSFVGIQTLYLATLFNPIYWNTACLIVNSGSADEGADGDRATDYSKIAKAIGDIISRGITVSLVNINKSDFGFRPDAENNQILFGMKALNNVGADLVREIVENRPYVSMFDFMSKVKVGKQAMISLIKAGAFDKLEGKSRKLIMGLYIWQTFDKKKRLTLQNFNGLVQYGLIPEELDFERRVFNFNKYIKAVGAHGKYFLLDSPSEKFYVDNYGDSKVIVENNAPAILQSDWQKQYTKSMDGARDWLKENQERMLDTYNKVLFLEAWGKYADGSISAWEMESMCFYYNEHELANIDKNRYGIVNFSNLPEEPEIDYTFKKGGRDIPIYKLAKIVGTVIAKNKTKATISLLTVDGVVEVRFRNEYFSLFDKQVSERQEDGTKKIVEKSWFNRGSMIMLTGYRRGDEFVPKKYAATSTHQLYRIDGVKENGELELRSERYGAA